MKYGVGVSHIMILMAGLIGIFFEIQVTSFLATGSKETNLYVKVLPLPLFY